jgi:hypothetical protein
VVALCLRWTDSAVTEIPLSIVTTYFLIGGMPWIDYLDWFVLKQFMKSSCLCSALIRLKYPLRLIRVATRVACLLEKAKEASGCK